MTKQIDLYLDFDGVLNIYGTSLTFSDTVQDTAEGWNLVWRQSVIDFINDLPENVNLVWLTTWEQRNLAEELLVPLLGITRPVSTIHRGFGIGWWKNTALEQYRAENDILDRPFIWIDDDLNAAMLNGKISANLRYLPSTLLISPDWTLGINEADMGSITKFVEDFS